MKKWQYDNLKIASIKIDSAILLTKEHNYNKKLDIEIIPEKPYRLKLIDCYIYKANLEHDLANFKTALNYYLKSLLLLEKENNYPTETQTDIFKGMAMSYSEMGYKALAEKYFNKTLINYLSYLKQFPTNEAIRTKVIATYIDLAILYEDQNKNKEAILYYKKAIDSFSNATSEQHFSNIYFNLAENYAVTKDTFNAKINYAKTIQLTKDTTDAMFRILYNVACGRYCFINKNYEKAINHFKILEKIVETGNFSMISKKVYMELALSYKFVNQPKNEVIYLRKLNDLNDSLYTKKVNDYQIELEQKYQSIQKEKKIAQLILTQQYFKTLIIQAEQKKQFYIIGIVSLIIIATILITVTVLLNKKNKVLIASETIISSQAAELAKQQSRMSPHFIFNALTNIQSSIIQQNMPQSLTQLVDFSKLMRTMFINSENDFITIKQELDFIRQYLNFELKTIDNIIAYNIKIDESISKSNTLIIPMLIQPFIENILKHAELKNKNTGIINISLTQEINHTLKITITDNGKGLPNGSILLTDTSHAIGIAKKRLELLKIKHKMTYSNCVEINNIASTYKKDTGVEVIIRIPFITLY